MQGGPMKSGFEVRRPATNIVLLESREALSFHRHEFVLPASLEGIANISPLSSKYLGYDVFISRLNGHVLPLE